MTAKDEYRHSCRHLHILLTDVINKVLHEGGRDKSKKTKEIKGIRYVSDQMSLQYLQSLEVDE